jgi:hypothetical protein
LKFGIEEETKRIFFHTCTKKRGGNTNLKRSKEHQEQTTTRCIKKQQKCTIRS